MDEEAEGARRVAKIVIDECGGDVRQHDEFLRKMKDSLFDLAHQRIEKDCDSVWEVREVLRYTRSLLASIEREIVIRRVCMDSSKSSLQPVH